MGHSGNFRVYILSEVQVVYCENHPALRAPYAVQNYGAPALHFVCDTCKPTVNITPLFP